MSTMSDVIYDWEEPNKLVDTITELWHQCEAALQSRNWSLLKFLVQRMVMNCGPHTWDTMDVEVCSDIAKMLVLAGKECNACMETCLAKDCFFHAIELQFHFSHCEACSDTMAEAIVCLLHTHLHNKHMESAQAMLDHWNKRFTVCHSSVSVALGRANLEFGLALVKCCRYDVAVEYLEAANDVLPDLDPTFNFSESQALLVSAMGYCCLMLSKKLSAHGYLSHARMRWKSLNWPVDHLKTIVYALKNYMECLLEDNDASEEAAVHAELLMLHSVLVKVHSDMLIADVFTCLGMVAFNKDREERSVVFFEQACDLHKQTKGHERSSEEIMKLLRFIGVASYNCLDFRKAADAYHESLHLLETQHCMAVNKTTHVAECCASLGFTYSRLRDFDNMLLYYERAFQLESKLSSEDLELIITNIGSLYHVKAVKLEKQGKGGLSCKYYEQAHAAFHKALRYSWKSFPFINYGYYLLCQGNSIEACSILQQGYLNGVVDKDTVEFDHTEDPILIEDLRHELLGLEFIRIPSSVISLYLKTLAQVHMGDVSGAELTAGHLESEVRTCLFQQYYCDGYGQDRMEALCKSLVGYAFRTVGCQNKATLAFESALCTLPHYDACKRNLQTQQQTLS